MTRPQARPTAAVGLVGVLIVALACGGGGDTPPPADGTRAPEERPGALLVEITEQVGLAQPGAEWPHGTFFMAEITGPGVGLFDMDDDGDLDIVAPRTPAPGAPEEPAPNRLYRQDDGRFVDVTETSGAGDPGFGQGVAVGDVDGDGDRDLYFTNYGPDSLYLNDGRGRFAEATQSSGIGGDFWSTSAAFCDYDRDGDLDLYVAHYVRYGLESDCTLPSGEEDYCGPEAFWGVHDTLYRNAGDGTFDDVSAEAGVRTAEAGRRAKGLGVVCTDMTGDGWPDFFVANDGEPNHLWVGHADGTFEEQAVLRGVAVNRHGVPEANMGIGLGDSDGDGTLDLYVTHLAGENNALYRGTGGPLFDDGTLDSRMADHDLDYTGFGCGFFDLDHDGDLDLGVANGRVARGPVLPGASAGEFWNRYAEPDLLLRNDGSGRYENASSRAGAFGSHVEVGRGLAFGDLDNDGDIDLVLSKADNRLRVFRNDAPPPEHHWLLVRALSGGRDAVGARVVVVAGERRWLRLVQPSGSYLNSNDPRAHFGLGRTARVDRIDVSWPDGSSERFAATDANRQLTLVQGSGESE